MVTPRSVVFVDHTDGLGGAEYSLLMLLTHLNRDHFAPYLVCPEGKLADAARVRQVQVYPLDFPRLRRSLRVPLDWSVGVLALARVARRVSADIIVSNTIRSSMYAGAAARLIGCPFVWTMRDFWLGEVEPRHKWTDTLGKRWLCGLADTIIANSEATARHVPCFRKVTVVHNGIDVARFDSTLDGQPFRHEFAIPRDALVVGTVGRLRPWKGQDRLVRVLARVCEALPEVRGVVVGGDPFGVDNGYGASLHQLADALGIGDRIVFTGQLHDPRPALAAMDIFVHPGDPEPFGLVNVEAMAMAKPVVAFAHGALPEVVIEGETGLLIPPEDESGMANAVLSLLKDPIRRTKLGEAGRLRAMEAFPITRTAREVEAVLNALH